MWDPLGAQPGDGGGGMMSKRALLAGVCVLAVAVSAVPFTSSAQKTGRVARVGFLSDESRSGSLAELSFGAIAQPLKDLGWAEGQNLVFERRYAEGREAILPQLAADLVRLKVDMIIALGTPAARAVKDATATIPVVFARVGDAVGSGLVQSLAHPGGNLTGLTIISHDLGPKRLELLKEAVPAISRVGVLWDPSFPLAARELKSAQDAARTLGIEIFAVTAQRAEQIDAALATLKRQRVGAVSVLSGPPRFGEHRRRIADLTAKAGLPMMAYRREFVEAGGLMSYGPNFADMYRRAATYVDRVLKGAKPADIPVEQPAKIELVINLRTAKAIGLTLPPSLLLRADQVIE